MYVTAIEVADEWDTVLRNADIAAVIEGRIAIETEAAALAAHRRTATDVRDMRQALEERLTSDQTLQEYVDADMALHRAVVAAAHNRVLLELFDGFVPRIRRAMIDMLELRPGTPDHAATTDRDAHADLVQAVVDAEPATAARLSRAHLTSLKDALV